MLTPEYLAGCTDYLLGLYDQLQTSIAQDIAKRLVKTGEITASSEWQIRRVQASGSLLDEVTEQVSTMSGYSTAEIKRLYQEAGVLTIKNDTAPLVKAGIKVDTSLSADMRQVLEASIAKCSGDMRNLTLTTATTAMQQYMDAANLAYMKVTSGGYSYQQAISQAVRAAAKAGSYVTFTGGGRSRLDVAIRRAVLTGVNQTAAKITEANAEAMGVEYYEVSAHEGARPSHADWQGQVYKIEGSTADYPNFYEMTGYGSGDGLCGWNCRHSFYPFWPGISKRAYTQEKLDWYNEHRVEYDGEELTDYECSQIQRSYERDIRDSKRVLASYDAAAKAATDEATETVFKEKFQDESVKLKAKEAKLKDFCKQTNRRVDSARTQVVAYKDSTGRIVNFGRSTSQKAVWANKKQVDKYAAYHYNKDGTIVVTDTASKAPRIYKENAIVEVTNAKGRKSRYLYDSSGNLVKQVDNSDHGKPKAHPFGKHGEHVHEYTWEDGKLISRTVRDLTDAERKEHSDIL